jgi:hypothetical protein
LVELVRKGWGNRDWSVAAVRKIKFSDVGDEWGASYLISMP